ncbi:UNVERIFIED_CONTAM: Retrovirus-related Pol polyprotein from transposon TNT 1-94 [Sesamum indicum]
MKGILIQQKVFKAIDGRYSDSISEEKVLENDEFAYSSIILNLSDNVLRKVGKQDTARDLWEKLEDLYTDVSLPMQDIKLTSDKNIDEYSPIVLLNAILDTYADVKAAIKYGRDSVSLDIVVNGLKSKEIDLKTNRPSNNHHEVNSVRGRSKFRNSSNRYNNRSKSRNKNRSKSRNRDYSHKDDKIRERRCYNCGIRGHYIKDCRKPRRDNRDNNREEKERVNNVTDESGEIFVISDVNSVLPLSMHEWLVDSGCTFHISPFESIFSNLKIGDFGSVSMANEKRCDIKGIGDISLVFDNGYRITLKHVRYVPELSHNLISCAALEDDGLEGRWGKGIMKIMKGSLVVFKAEKRRNLYLCSVTYDSLAASVNMHDKTVLWHKRFGHISQKGLEFLNKEGILSDNIDKLPFCDDCVMGKQHRVHFPATPSPNPSMSSCILDYIHADVWGPSKEPTHGGNRYFLSIVDNFSRKVFIFLLKHKYEVFEKFEKWKTLVENQTGKRLKSLRTDNGLEFCNKHFDNLCDKFGIKRHKTNPYTPQQNGVAERMNRTLLEKVRCLLISSGLQKSFWGEAVLTAAYLINLSPSVPLLGKSPETVWSGKKPDISLLRTFGCSAFVHQTTDKLEPRSLKCVFIGYPDGVKGYRLWVRSQPGFKVIISRDVTFNEYEMPCLLKTEVEPENLTFNKVEDNQEGGENIVETNNDEQNLKLEEDPLRNSLENYQLARDRSRRERKIPTRLNDFQVALNIENIEPANVDEALKSKEWLSAMNEEMKSLEDNHTWDLVPKPKNCSLVDCKWIFKIKQENPLKFKARLVAKGFTQKEGIDYNEIFSPVVKYTTVRIILALAAHFDWELKQMDVKTAFLHGDLDECIYMRQPVGFIEKNKPDHFLNEVPIFLVLYVDDMLITSPSLNLIESLQKDLSNNFEMKNLGDAKNILGMDIHRNRKRFSILLNQKSYIHSVLKRFSMENSKPTSVLLAAHFQLSKDQCPKTSFEKDKMSKVPYSNVIGSIMFLMVCTRPDIAYAISCLSRYMSNPGPPHWEALKWLLRYLCGTDNIGINFSKFSDSVNLIGYVDSNYANEKDSRKSTTSYIFTLCGSCISWKSQLQHIVALSTTEAEYIATTEAFKEAIWLEGLVKEIGFLKNRLTVFSDSQSSIQLCKNPVFHDRTKHIDVRFHFIRDIVSKEIIKLEKVRSEENPADMGTKSLPAEKFINWVDPPKAMMSNQVQAKTPGPSTFKVWSKVEYVVAMAHDLLIGRPL